MNTERVVYFYDSLKEIPIYYWVEFINDSHNLTELNTKPLKYLLKKGKVEHLPKILDKKTSELVEKLQQDFIELIKDDTYNDFNQYNEIIFTLSNLNIIKRLLKGSNEYDIQLNKFDTDSENVDKRINTLENKLKQLEPKILAIQDKPQTDFLTKILSQLTLIQMQINKFKISVIDFYQLLEDYNKQVRERESQLNR